jgi:hypothetical protein
MITTPWWRATALAFLLLGSRAMAGDPSPQAAPAGPAPAAAPAPRPPAALVTFRKGSEGSVTARLEGRDEGFAYFRDGSGRIDRYPLIGISWIDPRTALLDAPVLTPAEVGDLLGAPPPAPARRGLPLGMTLSTQVGYGVPWGRSTADSRFGLLLASNVPLQIDVDWALDANDRVGAFFEWGKAAAGGAVPDCGGPVSCSASDVRIGLSARHVFDPDGPLAISAAVSLGYEWASLEISERDFDVTVHGASRARGLVAGLQLSALRRLGAVRAGPFVGFTAGQFRELEATGPTFSTGWLESRDRAAHGFFETGLRLSYGP